MKNWFARTFPSVSERLDAGSLIILPVLFMLLVALFYGIADAALGIHAGHGLDAW